MSVTWRCLIARLEILAQIAGSQEIIPTRITFVDSCRAGARRQQGAKG